jgi:hypothetical protein
MRKITDEMQEDRQLLTDECKAEIQKTILRADDPRMQTVWDYLTRKNVKVNRNAASSLWREAFSEMPEPPWPPKDIALAGFFFDACSWAIFFLVFDPAVVEVARRHAKFWEGVTAQFSFAREQKPREKRLSPLTISLPAPGNPWAFLKDAHALEQNLGKPRMYVNQLANTTRSLYGTPRYSTLATTANVMLDLRGSSQVERDDVRYWVSPLR